MSSKKTKASTATITEELVNEVVSEVATATTNEEQVGESKRPGRPVNMDSERQKRLVEQEMKKLLHGGEMKRGRPVDPESDRQKKISNKTPGMKPGRPKMSEEQKAENERIRKENQKANAEKIAAIAREKLVSAGLWNTETNTVNEGVTKEQIKAAIAA